MGLRAMAAWGVGLVLCLAGMSPAQMVSPKAETVRLHVTMIVDKEVYLKTDFGEPPQIAVWMEQPETGKIRTVWVARRSGRRWWKGKVECPVALPYWESRHKREKSDYQERGLLKRFIDAISGATPTGGPFGVETPVAAGETWQFFVEVNLSADFNRDFPSQLMDGTPDTEVNGQPSLIYRGVIRTEPGQSAEATLLGRTDQWAAVDRIIPDLAGITTARDILSNIRASVTAE